MVIPRSGPNLVSRGGMWSKTRPPAGGTSGGGRCLSDLMADCPGGGAPPQVEITVLRINP